MVSYGEAWDNPRWSFETPADLTKVTNNKNWALVDQQTRNAAQRKLPAFGHKAIQYNFFDGQKSSIFDWFWI